jgi:hypothetical protein
MMIIGRELVDRLCLVRLNRIFISEGLCPGLNSLLLCYFYGLDLFSSIITIYYKIFFNIWWIKLRDKFKLDIFIYFNLL